MRRIVGAEGVVQAVDQALAHGVVSSFLPLELARERLRIVFESGTASAQVLDVLRGQHLQLRVSRALVIAQRLYSSIAEALLAQEFHDLIEGRDDRQVFPGRS